MSNISHEARMETTYIILSHVYAIIISVMAFFALFKFFQMMKIVVSFSDSIYWLSKAFIQQVSFIGMAIALFCCIIGGQAMFRKAMLKKRRIVPTSAIVTASILALMFAVCEIVIKMY